MPVHVNHRRNLHKKQAWSVHNCLSKETTCMAEYFYASVPGPGLLTELLLN